VLCATRSPTGAVGGHRRRPDHPATHAGLRQTQRRCVVRPLMYYALHETEDCRNGSGTNRTQIERMTAAKRKLDTSKAKIKKRMKTTTTDCLQANRITYLQYRQGGRCSVLRGVMNDLMLSFVEEDYSQLSQRTEQDSQEKT
jgi:hypothetical protein